MDIMDIMLYIVIQSNMLFILLSQIDEFDFIYFVFSFKLHIIKIRFNKHFNILELLL